MVEISVEELRARAGEIARGLQERHEKYVVTYRGRPLGLLSPIAEDESEVTGSRNVNDPWDELTRLGEAIGREWSSPLSSTELLSEMRR